MGKRRNSFSRLRGKNNVVYRSSEKQKFKLAVRVINLRMGLAQIVNLGSKTQLKET